MGHTAGMLSPDQIAHYRRHGYVTAGGLLGAGEVALLREAVQELLATAPAGPDQARDRAGKPVSPSPGLRLRCE